MEPLKSIPTAWHYKDDFRRIGDLVNFEGPELSLFEHIDTKSILIFDWVDHDDRFNRWLILQVTAGDVLEFTYGKITHRDLFDRAAQRAVYSVDICNQLGFSKLPVLQLMEIPEGYQPNHVHFDPAFCPDLNRVRAYLVDRVTSASRENRIQDIAQQFTPSIYFHGRMPKNTLTVINSGDMRITIMVKFHGRLDLSSAISGTFQSIGKHPGYNFNSILMPNQYVHTNAC